MVGLVQHPSLWMASLEGCQKLWTIVAIKKEKDQVQVQGFFFDVIKGSKESFDLLNKDK